MFLDIQVEKAIIIISLLGYLDMVTRTGFEPVNACVKGM